MSSNAQRERAGGSQRREVQAFHHRVREWGELKIQEFRQRSLGKGIFGDVCLGRIGDVHTAIKIFHEGKMRRDLFYKHLSKLTSISHPNIAQVYSYSTRPEQPIKVATEYMENSVSLQRYLQTSRGRPLSNNDLGYIAFQVANGMECLESKKLMHGSMTSNEVLVGDNLLAKIYDVGYGFSVEDNEYCQRRGNSFPYRWCPLECLREGKYSIKGDVWSFGVLLWVMFSEGQTPYPGLSNQEVQSQLSRGYRLKRPSNTPDAVYLCMTKCWDPDPESRPSFANLKSKLKCYTN